MSRIHEIETRMGELRNEQSKLAKEWQRLKSRALTRKMKKLFPDDEFTLEKVFRVDWADLGNGGYGEGWYKKITRYIEKLVGGTYNPDTGNNEGPRPLWGVNYGGNHPVTGQIAFKVVMRQYEPVEEQYGLMVILPHVTAYEGWKTFDIFEASLNRYGGYTLRISEDHTRTEVWEDRCLRYSREGGKGYVPMFTAEGDTAVEEALAFIHQRLPYERTRYDDEEEGY